MGADIARADCADWQASATKPEIMPSDNTVHIAIELSVSSWLVAARLPGIEKPRLRGDKICELTVILIPGGKRGKPPRLANLYVANVP
jgi:hypothetical protein